MWRFYSLASSSHVQRCLHLRYRISLEIVDQQFSSSCMLSYSCPFYILWMGQYHTRFQWPLHKPSETKKCNIYPFDPTTTFNKTYCAKDLMNNFTRSFFISQTFSKVLVHFSRSTGSYSTSPHSETSTQNSPLCKSTNSLFTRDVFSWSVTLYQPGSSSAYATQHDVNAITLKCRNFYFI